MNKITLVLTALLFLGQSLATLCIAHRGNNKEFFENSWAAIRSAVEVGSDGVEFDVHHTLMGKGILSHDKKLKRLAKSKPNRKCPLKTKISELTIDEIRHHCVLKNGEEVPTLKEVLDYLHDKNLRIVLEFKDVPTLTTLQEVQSALYNEKDRLSIISFKSKALDYIKIMSDAIPYFERVELLKLHAFFKKTKNNMNPNVRYSKKRINRLKKINHKFRTGVWTVDNERKMLNVLEAGIDYLTTNDPVKCLALKDQLHP